MTEQLWSVEFLIGHHERVALDYAGTRVVGPHEYMVVQPWQGDDEGLSTLHLDARAATPEVAAERALELYQRIREVAELPRDDDPQVVTIAQVAGVPRAADLFIFTADDMREQQQFGLAVVAAQIHCEMWIRTAIEEAAHRQGSAIADLAVSLPMSWTLLDRNSPRIFEALLGARPTDAPGWQSYKAHVARRNSVVHHGATVTRELADASIDASVTMVRFVQEVVASAAAGE
jgi:hypothetical protein